MNAYSLAYHDVTVGRNGELAGHKSLYKLTPKDFKKHIESIHSQNVAVEIIEGHKEWKDKTPVFLTFDDGELGSYLYVADELESKGWRGHFFITTDWIGKQGFLSRKQIRELRARGHVIGSHSCTHPSRMSQLSWDELTREWSVSRSILSDILGEPVRVASVPDGFYSSTVGQAAAASGIEVLFNSEATSKIFLLYDCMIVGRYFLQKHTPPSVSGAIAAGRTWPRLRQTASWTAKKIVKAVAGESYLTVRRYLLSTALRHNG
jgi:peptidoglycan/xylan/chitin deacetylase (PgdA/CDA1 family)